MFNFSFEYPLFLVLIPLFIICSIFCKAKSPSYIIPHLNIFEKSQKSTSMIQNILKFLVMFCSIIALASPYKQLDTQLIKNDGIDIVLSLDTSGSMQQLGFNKDNPKESRFDVVKDIVKDFIVKRVNDNISIIVFANSVMMATPLSFDKEAQKTILDYIEVGIIGTQTAMIDSLAFSINILKDSKAKSKVVILLSDGEDNYSTTPLDIVLKLLKKYSIKVYTIGIGDSNKIVLNKIAKQTNANSYIAYSKNDLGDIYEKINSLEKTKINNNKVVLKNYLFFYPLFLAIISLILFIYLKNRH
jgi:Ca-activated chloride channel family protein